MNYTQTISNLSMRIPIVKDALVRLEADPRSIGKIKIIKALADEKNPMVKDAMRRTMLSRT